MGGDTGRRIPESTEEMRSYLEHLVKVWPRREAVPGAPALVNLALAEAAARTGTLYELVRALDRCLELEKEPRVLGRTESRVSLREFVKKCQRWALGSSDEAPDWWAGQLLARSQAGRRVLGPLPSSKTESGTYHWSASLAPESATLASFRDFLVAHGGWLGERACSLELAEELEELARAWTGAWSLPEPRRSFATPAVPSCSSPLPPDRLWQRGSSPRPLYALGTFHYTQPLPVMIPGTYQLATASDSEVFIRDLATGECVQTLRRSDDYIAHIDATPDGRFLLACSQEKWVAWDLQWGRVVNDGRCHDTLISALAIAPDGSTGFSAGTWENKENEDQLERCRIFGSKVAPAGRHLELEGHLADVLTMAASPNGKQLLSGSEDGDLRLWSLHPTVQHRSMAGPEGKAVTRVLADGRWTAAASRYSNGEVRIWNLRDCRLRHLISSDAHSGFLDVWLSPSGDTLLGLMKDGCLTKWRLVPEPQLIRSAPLGDVFRHLAALPDLSMVILTRWDGFSSVWELGDDW